MSKHSLKDCDLINPINVGKENESYYCRTHHEGYFPNREQAAANPPKDSINPNGLDELESLVIKFVPTTSVMSLKQPTQRELAIEHILAWHAQQLTAIREEVERQKTDPQDTQVGRGWNLALDQVNTIINKYVPKEDV